MRSVSQSVVFTGPGEPIRIEEHPLREPRGREILVRVSCCTLCGSDLHTYTGRRSAPTPTILGHEIIGRIEHFGAEAQRIDLLGHQLNDGDRITWTIAASCGKCFFCTHDLPQKCEDLFKYGHEVISAEHPLSGGLADYCLLEPGTGIVRLPDDLPDEVACPANCATATIAAALRIGGGCQGKTVLIQGAGMLGLTTCAMARAGGAAGILCCDVNADRLALATRFGADRISLAETAKLRQQVTEMTAGRGVDLALELSGSSAAAETSLDLLRIGGTAVWVGAVMPVTAVALKPEMIVRRQLSLHGVHNYAPVDLATAVTFLAHNHRSFPFAELVTARYPLTETDRAFQQARDGKTVRVAVRPKE